VLVKDGERVGDCEGVEVEVRVPVGELVGVGDPVPLPVGVREGVMYRVAVPETETIDTVQGQQPRAEPVLTGCEVRHVGGSVRVLRLPLVQL
jgi:hypothetical protein